MGSNKTIIQSLIIFSTIVIFLVSWSTIVVPEMGKLSDDHTHIMEYDAQSTTVDDVYGKEKGPFFLRDIQDEKVISHDGDILTILSTITSERVDNREVVFSMENTYKVNAKTRMHVDKEGKQWRFLPGVEKKDYDFFHPAVFYDDPMRFVGTDEIKGLQVYVFEVTTKGADTSRAFPQFLPNTILTDTTSTLYIEPVTGEMIRFEKIWDNYLVEDGKRINTIQTGEKHTTKFTENILAHHIKPQIENLNYIKNIMPIFFAISILTVGLIWIMSSYLGRIKQESIQKDQMVAIGNITSKIAHDLRNPLNIVKMGLELNNREGVSPEIKKRRSELALRGVEKIDYQIKSILNFVRNSPLKIRQVQLSSIIDTAIKNSQIPQNIKIEKDISEITISVDFDLLETVFTNIITNAVHATRKGTITISAKIKTKTIEIEFKDTGPGIPKDMIKYVFEPLFTTKRKGTGLGLSSCKYIIEKHDGTVSVQNNPTRFTISLPRQ